MAIVRRVRKRASGSSRRTLYRRSKRVLARLAAGTWKGPRGALEPAVRQFLRARPRSYLVRVLRDRGFALAAAVCLMAAGATRAAAPVNLSDVAAGHGGFMMKGIDPGDNSGFSVSGAGDVNGDGLADLIVGAYAATPGGAYGAGESYVVFGKADGTPINLSAVAAGTGGFVINGIDFFDHSGSSVSGAGDVNGDGLADVIVGAPSAGASYAGESYVVFGKADGAPVNLSDIVAGVGGFAIRGVAPGVNTGRSVSGAGDVNNDGLADVIVGALGAAPGGRPTAGQSYVVFGKADGTAVDLADVVAGTGGFAINSINPYDQSGASVSGAGDVDGDGLPDVVIGARYAHPGGANFAGQSYVVFGKADGTTVELSDVEAGLGGFAINAANAYDLSASSVSGAGDVNGDSLADVIVAARGADPGGNTNAGTCSVVFGKADGATVSLADVAAGLGGFAINGVNAFDGLGSGVSGAGDVDGDGLADVIVSTQSANTYAGESYVVLGKADGAAVNLVDVVAGNGGFVMHGIDPFDFSGRSVSGAGDVNGDGFADVVVGAPNSGPYSVGESYLVFSPFSNAPRACCEPGGTCEILAPDDCLAAGGTPDLLGTACAGDGDGNSIDDFCEFQGCCFGDGSCQDLHPNECVTAGGTPGGTGTHCRLDGDGNSIDDFCEFQACCLPDGSCQEIHPNACVTAGGIPRGTGSHCAGDGDNNGFDDACELSGLPVNLADVANGDGGFVIIGRAGGDQTGYDVSQAGDVNGDGLADVIVGAPGSDPGGSSYAGECFVVFGKTDTTPVHLSDVGAGIGGFVMSGTSANDVAGDKVGAAGDVNGDGLADLVVGAPSASPGGNFNAGQAYVVFGKADGAPVLLSDVAAGNGGFIMFGIDPFGFAGVSVSGVGDMNHDGLSDVIVGAYQASPTGLPNAGQSYLVFGKADGTPVYFADIELGLGGFVINGAAQGDDSGRGVSGTGDVNGDGFADVVVGAYQADPGGVYSAGSCYVLFGKADTTAVSLADVASGTGGFVMNGIGFFNFTGRNVSGAGDVNGDGLMDVVVSARGRAPGGPSGAGASYVVFGKADTTPVELSDVAAGTGGFLINGLHPYDFADTASGAGDVNGDGLADLIVGAGDADPAGHFYAGQSYVVLGKADGAPVDLAAVVAGDGGFVINGIHAFDQSGHSVSEAGDVNNDGKPDVLIGAPAANNAQGEAYVVFSPFATVELQRCCLPDGSCANLSASACLSASGTPGGTGSACGGDANANGVDDACPCVWDCADGDGDVGVVDFLALLEQWGQSGAPCDFGGDGVDTVDFLAVLSHWGACP